MRSVRKLVKPPTLGLFRASGGRWAVPGTPTTRSPAPRAWQISTCSAVRQTTRRGNEASDLPYMDRSTYFAPSKTSVRATPR